MQRHTQKLITEEPAEDNEKRDGRRPSRRTPPILRVRWLNSTKQPRFLGIVSPHVQPAHALHSPHVFSSLSPRFSHFDQAAKWELQGSRRQHGSTRVAMDRSLESSYSIKDVTYSCGYCGYALNLSSSARNTAGIGCKYGKQIKKGVVPFVAVDESRFTLTDEVTCTPYFRSGRSWGLFRRRSRLLCRKCGGRIGNAYEVEDGRDSCGLSDADGFSDDMRASSGSGGSARSASSHMNYLIRISALQPTSDDSDAL